MLYRNQYGAAAFVAVILWIGCAEPAEVGSPPPRITAPPAELEGVEFQGYRRGDSDIEVLAKRATVNNEDRVVDLEAVRIQFRDPYNGSVEVRAKTAKLEMDTDDFVLSGGVTGTTADGAKFETAEIHFDQARNRMHSTHPVRFYRGQTILRGQRMEFDVPTHTLRLTGGVSVRAEGG